MTALYIILGILALVIIYVISAYNGIVKLENTVKNSWANVLVQEEQKQKIIPKLLEAVKGYSDIESSLQTKVTELRTMTEQLNDSNVLPEEIQKIEDKSSDMLRSIQVSVENYPDLKSSELYQNLMTEITEQQENVGASLRIFNSNVNIHNSTIRSFPANLVNGMINKRQEVTMFNKKSIEESVGVTPSNL